MEGGKSGTAATGSRARPRGGAGGECASGGDDLTGTAVAQGGEAAEDSHAGLS